LGGEEVGSSVAVGGGKSPQCGAHRPLGRDGRLDGYTTLRRSYPRSTGGFGLAVSAGVGDLDLGVNLPEQLGVDLADLFKCLRGNEILDSPVGTVLIEKTVTELAQVTLTFDHPPILSQ